MNKELLKLFLFVLLEKAELISSIGESLSPDAKMMFITSSWLSSVFGLSPFFVWSRAALTFPFLPIPANPLFCFSKISVFSIFSVGLLLSRSFAFALFNSSCICSRYDDAFSTENFNENFVRKQTYSFHSSLSENVSCWTTSHSFALFLARTVNAASGFCKLYFKWTTFVAYNRKRGFYYSQLK